MADKEGGRLSQFIVTSLTPDVCKSPIYPVPYPIVGYLEQSVRFSPNVRFKGQPVFHMQSRVATVVGDEAGVGGGVVSNVFKGFCRPITANPTVKSNGSLIVWHLGTMMWMNCAGPEGPGNTVGILRYLPPMVMIHVSPSGDIPPGDPPVAPETPAERGFLGGMGNSFVEGGCDGGFLGAMGPGGGGLLGGGLPGGGLLGSFGSPEGLVGLAQQAYGLATTDWSNPGAVLGAIGGVAGMSGFGEVAQAAALAQKGLALATTDWSNPGAILGAAMNLGGPSLLSGLMGGGGGGGEGGFESDQLPPGIKPGGCF